jgi:hypothetical protein
MKRGQKKLSRYYICPIVNHSAATFLLLGLYSQKAKLKIKSAKMKFFLTFSIARFIRPKFQKNREISIHGSTM